MTRYCAEANRNRIDKSHFDFFNGAVNFAAVSVILVLTRCDELRDLCQGRAFREYQKSHPHVHGIEAIPEEDRIFWQNLRDRTYETEKKNCLARWRHVVRPDTHVFFVSSLPQGRLFLATPIMELPAYFDIQTLNIVFA